MSTHKAINTTKRETKREERKSDLYKRNDIDTYIYALRKIECPNERKTGNEKKKLNTLTKCYSALLQKT